MVRFDFWCLTVLRKRESSDIYKVRGVLRLKENGKGVSVRSEGILVSGGGKRGMWCMSRVTPWTSLFLVGLKRLKVV